MRFRFDQDESPAPINRARANDVPIRNVHILAGRQPPIRDDFALFVSKKSDGLAEFRFTGVAKALRHVSVLVAYLG
jgi:hypothetical protein